MSRSLKTLKKKLTKLGKQKPPSAKLKAFAAKTTMKDVENYFNRSDIEFCKRHNVDYTGTSCGGCDHENRRNTNKLSAIRKLIKEYENTPADYPEDDHCQLGDLLYDIKKTLRRRK